eukprot:7990399-Ditylum_brightwellii.AAC.1
MFPKKTEEVHALVDYSVKDHGYKNVNKVFVAKTIFKSSKDNAVCIGHLTHLNPIHINRAQYQDDINELMEALAEEKEQKDDKFYSKYSTTKEFTKFQIHLRTGKAYVKENNQHYETDVIG